VDISTLIDSNLFAYVILPFLILIARVCDVTIGTVRIMFIARGNKLFAPILGFFEILIWLLAIQQIMRNLGNAFCYLAYAGGFAIGNYIGITIEEKVAYGKVVIQIITSKDASELFRSLRKKGFGVTKVAAEGASGPVSIVYSIIDRLDLDDVVQLINRFNPKAFYTIEDIRSVKEGIFPENIGLMKRISFKTPKFYRQLKKSKRTLLQRKSK
jgi:uncharacterized protein YebE (UPF0316 family)